MDGKGRDVRLQHPLGVAWNKANGKLYLVDSYNHKVISACLEGGGGRPYAALGLLTDDISAYFDCIKQ